MTAVQPQPDLDLGALKELCEKATPGPWEAGLLWVYTDPIYEDDKRLANVLGVRYADEERQKADNERVQANVVFIAAARTAVPALVAAVERLTAERDTARSLAAALEQEGALKDEALAELRTLHVLDVGFETPYCAEDGFIWPCPTARILDALAARIDAHLFPTDEEGASDE